MSAQLPTRSKRAFRSAPSGRGDELADRLVDEAVGGDGAADEGGGVSGEVGEAATGFFDDDFERRQIPGLEVDVDHRLRLPAGDEGVAEIVAVRALAAG